MTIEQSYSSVSPKSNKVNQMNSYFLAIQQATSNDQFPELADAWRNYHPEAILSDSDYSFLTDTND